MRTIQSGSLEEYLRSIWDALSLGLTLEKSKSIQEMLRPDSKMRFCVRLEGHDFFIEIGAGQPAKLHRSLPDNLEEVILPKAAQRTPQITSSFLSEAQRLNSFGQSVDELASFLSMDRIPSRDSLNSLIRWSPVFETIAYSAATSLANTLDKERIIILEQAHEIPPIILKQHYWLKLTLVARLFLISSPPEAKIWQAPMATSFEWMNWTPSWLLFRERSLWLMAIAARMVASCGPAVIDRYFKTFERNHAPMKTFDALFGIVAAAFASNCEHESIVERLRHSIATLNRQGSLSHISLRVAVAQAEGMLTSPSSAIQRSHNFVNAISRRKGFCVPDIIGRDGTDMISADEVGALTILPAALAARSADFFPQKAHSRPERLFSLTSSQIEELFDSAWSTSRVSPSVTLN